jgi:hypothetical protein
MTESRANERGLSVSIVRLAGIALPTVFFGSSGDASGVRRCEVGPGARIVFA